VELNGTSYPRSQYVPASGSPHHTCSSGLFNKTFLSRPARRLPDQEERIFGELEAWFAGKGFLDELKKIVTSAYDRCVQQHCERRKDQDFDMLADELDSVLHSTVENVLRSTADKKKPSVSKIIRARIQR
jgi:hypothetical protein